MLAGELKTKLDIVPGLHGMMFVEENPPRVEIPDIIEGPEKQIRFMVGLHELGHVAWGHTQGRLPVHSRENCPRVKARLSCDDCCYPSSEAYYIGDLDWQADNKFYFENGVLKSEAQAWEWALNSRLDYLRHPEELSQKTREFMWEFCLRSYLQGAAIAGGRPGQQLWNGNRHHVRFTYDEPDDYFWGIAERLKGDSVDEEKKIYERARARFLPAQVLSNPLLPNQPGA